MYVRLATALLSHEAPAQPSQHDSWVTLLISDQHYLCSVGDTEEERGVCKNSTANPNPEDIIRWIKTELGVEGFLSDMFCKGAMNYE